MKRQHTGHRCGADHHRAKHSDDLVAEAREQALDRMASPDRVDELIRVLERAAGDEEGEAKIKLLFKIATLYDAALQQLAESK